jgi:hypothetical protein
VGRRLHGATALEKLVYAVLLLVLAVDVGLIVFARADDDTPAPSGSAAVSTSTSTSASASSPATTPATTSETSGEPPPCSEVEGPGPGGTPVTCRTRSATLTIVDEARPLVLGATQVRLFEATLNGLTLTTRLRIRNETDAEQGVIAGGQEIYLNLGGVRTDPDPIGDVRVPTMEAVNTAVRFTLTPARVRRIREAGGRAELGVKPWDEDAGGPPGTIVGVIRFRAA